MTYEEFKAAFEDAFRRAAIYDTDQIGYRLAVDRMAELADLYPEFEERMFEDA